MVVWAVVRCVPEAPPWRTGDAGQAAARVGCGVGGVAAPPVQPIAHSPPPRPHTHIHTLRHMRTHPPTAGAVSGVLSWQLHFALAAPAPPREASHKAF